jgi:hypothetical protein
MIPLPAGIINKHKRCAQSYTYSVRPDASSSSAVNAALSSTRDCSNPVRPDASINSAVNAALSSLSVRPELVEGYELISTLKEKCSLTSTSSVRTEKNTKKKYLVPFVLMLRQAQQ